VKFHLPTCFGDVCHCQDDRDDENVNDDNFTPPSGGCESSPVAMLPADVSNSYRGGDAEAAGGDISPNRKGDGMIYPFVWTWKTRLPERRGMSHRVIARGKLNSCMVEFEDGERFVTSRNALRRRKEAAL